ncbi:MAG TPA: hypothetical protein VF151_10715 [Gemmatimonadales bacterium]
MNRQQRRHAARHQSRLGSSDRARLTPQAVPSKVQIHYSYTDFGVVLEFEPAVNHVNLDPEQAVRFRDAITGCVNKFLEHRKKLLEAANDTPDSNG